MKVPEKHRAVAHAWVDGARVGYKLPGSSSLLTYTDSPQWSEAWHYEVMPTPDSIDWSHVAEKYVAMARGKHGDVDLCTQIPEPDTCYWHCDGEFTSAIGFKSLKIGTTEWQDSLVLRPKDE